MEVRVGFYDFPLAQLSFEQVSRWQSPHDGEVIERDHQLRILRNIGNWLRDNEGFQRVWVMGHGYVD